MEQHIVLHKVYVFREDDLLRGTLHLQPFAFKLMQNILFLHDMLHCIMCCTVFDWVVKDVQFEIPIIAVLVMHEQIPSELFKTFPLEVHLQHCQTQAFVSFLQKHCHPVTFLSLLLMWQAIRGVSDSHTKEYNPPSHGRFSGCWWKKHVQGNRFLCPLCLIYNV